MVFYRFIHPFSGLEAADQLSFGTVFHYLHA
jgi:hypothetical protein